MFEGHKHSGFLPGSAWAEWTTVRDAGDSQVGWWLMYAAFAYGGLGLAKMWYTHSQQEIEGSE